MSARKNGPAGRSSRREDAPQSDGLLTVNQVAVRLCMGRSTVYDLITKGQLGAVKIGRSRRVPVSALNRFIAERLT
ncbi:MAG: hypothetical protein PVSMB7_29450 [Chloroflexota bacterium]